MRSTQVLSVAMNGIEVGQWWRSINGANFFQYHKSWLDSPYRRSISLSLPLSQKIYQGDVVYNFFDNLLPDSIHIRSRIQQRFQTKTSSVFDLLTAIGRDCVGAIQLYQGEILFNQSVEAQPLTENEIEQHLNSHIYPTEFNELNDFRISLAGAQEKTAFLWYQDKWHRPLGSTPTSHIFKLPIGIVGQGQLDLSDSCENEWLCLQIFQKLGLNSPFAEIASFGENKVLIVERFDRRWSKDKRWLIRLPQEDICQALNIPSALKYENDGGATILQILHLLRGSSDPIYDRKQFFKAQILFLLLCAIDGHAKNFSLFLATENRYKLTPFYDVISAYPLISKGSLAKQKVKMAMSWQGENKHYLWDKIQLRHIYETAKIAGFSSHAVEEILNEIYRDMSRLNDIKIDHLPLEVVEPIFEGIETKFKKLTR